MASAAAIALVVSVLVPGTAQAATLPSGHVDTGLAATDIAPLTSPDLKASLGGPESAPVDVKPGTALDASTKDVSVVTPSVPSKKTLDVASATLTGRDEYADKYVDASGQHWAVVSPMPKNAFDSKSGSYLPLSTALEAATGGAEKATLHPLAPVFAASADSPSLVTATRNGYTITESLVGAAAAKLTSDVLPKIAAKNVTYAGVFPGVDLSYHLDAASVADQLTLNTAPLVPLVWTWHYTAPGLLVKQNDAGDLNFVDPGGNIVFSVPPPTMWDSSAIDGVQGNDYGNVATTFTTTKDGIDLVMRPDQAWLTKPGRVFPVIVDPTLNPGGTAFSANNSNGAHRSDGVLTGNSRSSGDSYWRTNVTYNYSAAAGTQITGGYFQAQYGGEGTTTTAQPAYVDWSSCTSGFSCLLGTIASMTVPSGSGSGTSTTGSGVSGSPNAVASFYDGRVTVNDLGAYMEWRGNEVAGSYTYKLLSTSLVLGYNQIPTTSSFIAPTPGNGTTAQTLTPTFSAVNSDPEGDATGMRFSIWDNAATSGTPIYQGAWSGNSAKVPQGYLLPATQYWWKWYVHDGWDGAWGNAHFNSAGPWTFTTDTPAPAPAGSSTTPVDGSVVVTTTPTLQGTIPSAAVSSTKYQFQVSTDNGFTAGRVIFSDWTTQTAGSTYSWTVPSGVLLDGGSYYWRIATDNGTTQWASSWSNQLKVNLRLGTSGPSPFDTAGPVTVNLANGNAALSFSSPTINTVGGAIGESFAFNSQAVSASGLTGRYFDAVPTGGGTPDFTETLIDTKSPLLTRIDTTADQNWNTGTDPANPQLAPTNVSPGPGVAAANYEVRWTGFVNLPAGNYTFGVKRGGGATVAITVGGTRYVAVNQWTDGNSDTALNVQDGAITVPMPGGAVPIQIDTYNKTGPAVFALSSKLSGGIWATVPATAYTRTFQTLPAGWGASTALAGAAAAYSTAQVTTGAVTLTDSTGTIHTYTKTSTGGYTPPAGEYGTVSLDAAGKVTFTDDGGTVYLFDGSGRVSAVAGPSDARKPASPVPSYRIGTGQVDWIADALSTDGAPTPSYSRKVTFAYGGDLYSRAGLGLSASDSDSTNTACPVPATPTGFVAAPTGMLCRIVYPGHVAGSTDTSSLLYNGNGQLARIVDPGGEVTDFEYDTQGRITTMRSSVANDWLAYTGTTPSANQKTEIQYTNGRVTQVTLPAPDGVTASSRPQKTYSYTVDGSGLSTGPTYVDVAGITPPTTAPANGHAGTVTFDPAFRQLTSRSATGLVASQTWSAKDQLLTSTSATGLETTTIYDPFTDRATDSYGPAPTACFATTGLPQSCSATMPPAHTATNYDENMVGLNVAWFNNPDRAGLPADYSTGYPGSTGGAISSNWPAVPTGISGIGADNFSSRGTGYVTFPTAGSYTFEVSADDAAWLWVNDTLIIQETTVTTSGPSITVNATAGQRQRIRLCGSDRKRDAQPVVEKAW